MLVYQKLQILCPSLHDFYLAPNVLFQLHHPLLRLLHVVSKLMKVGLVYFAAFLLKRSFVLFLSLEHFLLSTHQSFLLSSKRGLPFKEFVQFDIQFLFPMLEITHGASQLLHNLLVFANCL